MPRGCSKTSWGTGTVPLAFALGLLVGARSLVLAQDTKLAKATQQIEKRINDSHADVGVVFRTIDGKTAWSYHADESFHAASTMKVPVMIELFHQVKEGKFRVDDPLPVRNEFHSIVDGSVYKLDPKDDSETELYLAEGQTRTFSQLCELMITTSSNLATNILIEKLGVENIRSTVDALGAEGMNVLRGVEDGKAFEKGLNNTTTAEGLAVLLTAIAGGKAVDADASRQMVEILFRQHFNDGIPAGLPPGMKVAHKTGEIRTVLRRGAVAP
jgi:beta-lactamase class A